MRYPNRHDHNRKNSANVCVRAARSEGSLSIFLIAFLFAGTILCGSLCQDASIFAAPALGSRILDLLFDAPAAQSKQGVSTRSNGYWLLNARDLSRPSDEHLTADYIQVSWREPPNGLEESSLIDADPILQGCAAQNARTDINDCVGIKYSDMVDSWPEDEPLVIFIHGNLGTMEVAQRHGDLLHEILPREEVPPFQLAVWAWRADREIRRTMPDAQIKAARTDEEAYRLAVFLRELPPNREVIFIGYSFGARLASGALHLLEGGTLEGRTLDLGVEESSDTAIDEKRWTLYLLAPAMDADWFRPGGLYGETLNDVKKVFVAYNRRDRALKMFSRAELPGRKRMMGVLRTPCTLGDGYQPRWIDLTGEVGFRHGFARSSESPSFRRSLHELLAPAPETLQDEDAD